MATTLKNDELNINQPYKERSEPYDKFFGIMALSKRQIWERILFAEDFEDIFFEFLMFMTVLNDLGMDYQRAQDQLQERYRDKMFEYLPVTDSDFINQYAAEFASNAVETTAKHIKDIHRDYSEDIQRKIVSDTDILVKAIIEQSQEDQLKDDNWYVSLDRAKYNAENEANTILNRSDFIEAREAGYKLKRWLTEHDDRVRFTHSMVEGITIPIDSLFVVGDSVFSYPRDMTYSPNPNEYIGCRCSVEYLR